MPLIPGLMDHKRNKDLPISSTFFLKKRAIAAVMVPLPLLQFVSFLLLVYMSWFLFSSLCNFHFMLLYYHVCFFCLINLIYVSVCDFHIILSLYYFYLQSVLASIIIVALRGMFLQVLDLKKLWRVSLIDFVSIQFLFKKIYFIFRVMLNFCLDFDYLIIKRMYICRLYQLKIVAFLISSIWRALDQ